MRIVIGTALLAFALAACSSAGTSVDTSPDRSDGNDATPRASLRPSSQKPTTTPEGDPLTGRLGTDSVEGGCGYLATPDGTRYEVIYPEGWELRLTPLELIAPDGSVVARGGDEVTVVGATAGDMASICQIGPIFRATAVES